MAWSFRGEATNKVDPKGRVSIPASFRPVIVEGDPNCTDGKNPDLVLAYGVDHANCLQGYSIARANEIEEEIKRLPYGRQRDKAELRFSAQSAYLTIDHNGRTVIPAKMRARFGIEDEVVFVGMNDKFQLWEPSAYADYVRAMDEEDDGMSVMEMLNSVRNFGG